jgi:alpha-mannosidase
MGLKLYRIIPATGSSTLSTSQVEAGMRPRPYLENEFLRVEINPATGNIARLFAKKAHREVFKGEGNFLVALEETTNQAMKLSPEYAGPAWDIGLTGVKWDMDKGASVELIEQGPVRATLRVVQRFRKSKFSRDISLVAGVPRVDVQMSIDWHERSTFLKVGFPVGVSSTQVTAEIPYGAIARDQTGKEMVMGKWVDVSDASYGVSILNNGRHGFDARDNVMRISAIRGPVAPDPRTDEGMHSFGYSVYPHQGGWKEGKVEFQALEFNSPLVALQEPVHNGSDDQTREGEGLPSAFSFVKTDSDHVILYAMKQMEGFYDTDSILRFFECEGREGEVTVQFPFKVHAVETNLLEETLRAIGDGPTIKFHIKPWEITSIRIARVD